MNIWLQIMHGIANATVGEQYLVSLQYSYQREPGERNCAVDREVLIDLS